MPRIVPINMPKSNVKRVLIITSFKILKFEHVQNSSIDNWLKKKSKVFINSVAV